MRHVVAGIGIGLDFSRRINTVGQPNIADEARKCVPALKACTGAAFAFSEVESIQTSCFVGAAIMISTRIAGYDPRDCASVADDLPCSNLDGLDPSVGGTSAVGRRRS